MVSTDSLFMEHSPEELTQIRAEIKQAIKGNAILFASNRELRRLPLYLLQNEHPINIVSGSPGRGRGRGIIVATNYRVLFIRDGWIFRNDQDYPYETISSVEFKSGIFFGTLTLFGKGDDTPYIWVGKFKGQKFKKLVQELSMKAKTAHESREYSRPSSANNISSQKTQILNDIRALEQLMKEGIITVEEFEQKKTALLNQY